LLCGIEAMKGTNTPDKVKYIEKIIKENNVIKYFLVFIEDSLKRI